MCCRVLSLVVHENTCYDYTDKMAPGRIFSESIFIMIAVTKAPFTSFRAFDGCNMAAVFRNLNRRRGDTSASACFG